MHGDRSPRRPLRFGAFLAVRAAVWWCVAAVCLVIIGIVQRGWIRVAVTMLGIAFLACVVLRMVEYVRRPISDE